MSTGAVDFLSVPQEQSVVVKPKRGISSTSSDSSIPTITITADAVVREEGDDELVVTKHPVEQGSTISDHAYALPSRLRLIYGWSSSSSQANGDPQFLQSLYQTFLLFRANRTILTVQTGKRLYQNMILTSIRLDTESKTENALLLFLTLEEVLMATTQVVAVPSSTNQANPSKTAPVVPQGQQNLQPAPNFNQQSYQLLPSHTTLQPVPSH